MDEERLSDFSGCQSYPLRFPSKASVAAHVKESMLHHTNTTCVMDLFCYCPPRNQALPSKNLGVEGCEALRDPQLSAIQCHVADANETALSLAESDEPALMRVGSWECRGGMLLYGGEAATLSNSRVQQCEALGKHGGADLLVAVKTVSLDADAESIAMMRREIQILAELGDEHPNILPMLYSAQRPNELLLITPYACGGDLERFLPSNISLVEIEARRLTLQILSGLAHLHVRSIIHGDIKPANIFLIEDSGAMLALLSDFGLSVKVASRASYVRLKTVQGSYGYIPSEVIHASELRCESDLFALGVMIFTYLGGHDPFYPKSNVKSVLEFDENTWRHVSADGRAFATQLLSVDFAKRGAAAELIATHLWFATPPDSLGEERNPLLCYRDVRFLDLKAAHRLWICGIVDAKRFEVHSCSEVLLT